MGATIYCINSTLYYKNEPKPPVRSYILFLLPVAAVCTFGFLEGRAICFNQVAVSFFNRLVALL